MLVSGTLRADDERVLREALRCAGSREVSEIVIDVSALTAVDQTVMEALRVLRVRCALDAIAVRVEPEEALERLQASAAATPGGRARPATDSEDGPTAGGAAARLPELAGRIAAGAYDVDVDAVAEAITDRARLFARVAAELRGSAAPKRPPRWD